MNQQTIMFCRDELKLVQDQYGNDNSARVDEIRQAIDNPRWTKAWPLWDRQGPDVQE